MASPLSRSFSSWLIILAGLTPAGCGLLKQEFAYIQSGHHIPAHDNRSVLNHLAFLSNFYLDTYSSSRIPLSSKGRAYIQSIYQKIAKNNELLLPVDKKVKFYFIEEATPLVFSLPDGHIFMSSGLLKYLSYENLFVSVLTFEYIKSFRGIYKKWEIIPFGYITTPHIISLTRIDLKVKMEINKWSYLAMKRAGYDPSAILSWIRIQNKNSMDFTLLNGRGRFISEEEFLFKNFLAVREKTEEPTVPFGNSSEEFYDLVNDIKKKSNLL